MTDLAHLAALARVAKAGPWYPRYGRVRAAVVDGQGHYVTDYVQAGVATGEFIAACDPTTVLGMVDEMTKLRERVAFLEGEIETAKALTKPMRDEIIAHCDRLAARVFESRGDAP